MIPKKLIQDIANILNQYYELGHRRVTPSVFSDVTAKRIINIVKGAKMVKETIGYWYCQSCHTEFQLEQEPGYLDWEEAGGSDLKQPRFCPFCGSENIEKQE